MNKIERQCLAIGVKLFHHPNTDKLQDSHLENLLEANLKIGVEINSKKEKVLPIFHKDLFSKIVHKMNKQILQALLKIILAQRIINYNDLI